MNAFLPLISDPERSMQVFGETETFLNANSELRKRVVTLGWTYHSLERLIPQTWTNLFSGHLFPYVDSWEEMQASANFCFMGFYKQAFVSLRNALELGILCVYFNIDDQGHERIQNWLRSKESHEASTPRTEKIWKELLSNQNIRRFDEQRDMRGRFNDLSFLSNFVHSKGIKYSNRVGLLKGNYQTFEENSLQKWIDALGRVVELLVLLYLSRFPIGTVRYDWSRKCGIDNPFPVLEPSDVDRIEELIDPRDIQALRTLAKEDSDTRELFDHIVDLPDMTSEDVEEQIVRLDKLTIEGGIGFIEWEKEERARIHTYSEEAQAKIRKRIARLREWAEENDLMDRRY